MKTEAELRLIVDFMDELIVHAPFRDNCNVTNWLKQRRAILLWVLKKKEAKKHEST